MSWLYKARDSLRRDEATLNCYEKRWAGHAGETQEPAQGTWILRLMMDTQQTEGAKGADLAFSDTFLCRLDGVGYLDDTINAHWLVMMTIYTQSLDFL